MNTVAVDFDGVLHTYDYGWGDGSIYGGFVPGAVVGLSTLMQRHAVFVHTSRNPRQVARWIERQTGYAIEATAHHSWLPWRRKFWTTKRVLLVTNRKLPAVVYIDDRGIRFESWEQVLGALKEGGSA